MSAGQIGSESPASVIRPGMPDLGHRCLYIDLAYSLEEVIKREHFQFFIARQSGGYFEKVIGLHPLADRVRKLPLPIVRERFDENQDMIEADSGTMNKPAFLAPFNLLVSQYRLLRHVTKIVSDEKIDVVIANDGFYGGLFGVFVKWQSRIPLVINYVTSVEIAWQFSRILIQPRLFPFKWLQDAVLRFVTRRADLVAAGSKTLADYAIRMGAKPDHVKIFSTAKYMVPAHRVPPDERGSADDICDRHDIPRGAPLFITIARHDPCKHVDHAIRAMRIVVDSHPDAILLLAGAGQQTGELRALGKELGIEGNLRFLGLVPQSALTRLTPHCVALSPLTGMALFEAAMAGSPAIAYDADSMISEIVINGQTGIVVPYLDFREMGRAAAQMIENPAQLAKFRTNMLAHARHIADLDRLYSHEAKCFDRMFATFRREGRSVA